MTMGTEKVINSRVEKIADFPFYTEGPAIDSQGNIYCTTLTGGSILKVDRAQRITHWASSDCPNGQIILPNDEHLICDIGQAAIRRFDAEGQFIRNDIEKFCDDIPIHTPNDLVVDASGNIYFTDSIREEGKICFVGIDGTQRILASGLDYPNGLVVSPDQQWLYIAESYKNRIIRIDLKQPGVAMSDIKVFAALPVHPAGKPENNLPDGLTLDAGGNLWVAHYGMQAVHQLSPDGQLLLSINTAIPLTSNLVFVDEYTLIVTGGHGEPGPGSLHKIHLLP
ncbi:SMP-30/gluconolactonase/LRE family protein [Chitinophaga sp. MM2321]|uniref:SMP-30/gluconolactonase/LRE family protein n=1 Tax=Chitinophaga sp. MM2321 TaxID=3137178 RepID=UPI0032D57FD6